MFRLGWVISSLWLGSADPTCSEGANDQPATLGQDNILLQLRKDSKVSKGSTGGTGTGDAAIQAPETIIPVAANWVESVVPALGGYLASEMINPNTAIASVGHIKKYNMDGTADDNFTPITVDGGVGLAISSDGLKLYVAAMGSAKEYDLTSSGGTLVRSFDVSQHTSTTNGICLSSDDSLLYMTEPGWAINQGTFQIEQLSTSAFLFAIDLSTGTVESLLPHMVEGHSPNGCVVSPDDNNVVYMANLWHGVTAWDKNNGNVDVAWGGNIQTDTRTEGANQWGDGIVQYGGRFYISAFRVSIAQMALFGKIYSCDPKGTDCNVLTETVAADIQLDLREADHPYLLLPQMGFVSGMVQRFELPVASSSGS